MFFLFSFIPFLIFYISWEEREDAGVPAPLQSSYHCFES